VWLSFCISFVLLLFLPSKTNGQELPSPEDAKANAAEAAASGQQVAATPGPGNQEKHPRLFWIIPTYSVSNSKLPSRLSPHDKFHLFVKNAIDPYTLGYTAFAAGLA
jgi:hypothetical protein